MKKNKNIIKELVKLRFQNLMMFRLGFFGPFFVDGSLFLIQLMVFEAVYSSVDSIGGWGRGEMIIFIGTFSLINGLNMVLYFFGVNGIPDKIKSGEMDLYLTKPVSPLLRLTFENVNPGSIPLVLLSFGIIGYGILEGGITVTFWSMLKYSWWILLMTILWYEMEVIIRSMSFFVVSTTSIVSMESAGIDLCMKIPGVAFRGVYKIIFYCILPYGIMATFPTSALIGEDSLQMMLFGMGIVTIFGILTAVLWNRGIRRYHSPSS